MTLIALSLMVNTMYDKFKVVNVFQCGNRTIGIRVSGESSPVTKSFFKPPVTVLKAGYPKKGLSYTNYMQLFKNCMD